VRFDWTPSASSKKGPPCSTGFAPSCIPDVGGGIKLGTFRSPAGDLIGLIENPVFKLQPAPIAESDGPGR
jgi:hypothetical protein